MCTFWCLQNKGLGVYEGRNLASPIKMAGHPYNSAACTIPCNLWYSFTATHCLSATP